MRRATAYASGAALALALALGWAFAPAPLQVEQERVGEGPFEMSIEEDGKTRVQASYTVAAPLAGMLERITLREGDPVAAGDMVALVRPAPAPLLDRRTSEELNARWRAAQAELQRADALLASSASAWRTAQDQLRRTDHLFRSGFLAQAQLDQARLDEMTGRQEHAGAIAQRDAARFSAEQARAALAASSPGGARSAAFPVRAPVGGRVLRVLQANAGPVVPGTALLELGDPRALEVLAELLTADAAQVHPGSAVRIERWGGPALHGRVLRVEPAAFTKVSALGIEEQRVRVVIGLLDAPAAPQRLGVGYRVTVSIVTAQRERVRKVPVGAVFPLPGDAPGSDWMGVYRIEQGRARLRRVRIGGRNNTEAWVADGLATGDAVVVYPPPALRDGQRVAVRSVAAPG